MWYLQQDTLVLITIFVFLIILIRGFTGNKLIKYLMPLMEIGALYFISKSLLLLMVVYLLFGFLGSCILYRFKSKILFLLLTLLSLVPLILSRAESIGISLPFVVESIGIAYQLLKVIDGFYYVYYAREPLKFIAYVNYLLFLPVFTAGPIFRYRDFLKTFENPNSITPKLITDNFKRIIRGFFKKVVLEVFILKVFHYGLNLETYNFFTSLLIIFLSYFLLYIDLSGYTDIAIGFGSLTGYEIPENFKKPWKAPSFTKFWRCWHATLSDWIREHVFILVGRRKISKYYGALLSFIVMMIMEFWHGFTFVFFIAGIYNGSLLALENILGLTTVNVRKVSKIYYYFRAFLVNFLFAVNTLFFFLPLDKMFVVLKGLVNF